MPVYVDENGKPVATATPSPTYVDENGNPIQTETTPAAARVANVVKAKGGKPEDAWNFFNPLESAAKAIVHSDYAGAVVKGVAGALGLPTSLDDQKPAYELADLGKERYDRYMAAKSTGRKAQVLAETVPMLGPPAIAVANPALAYSEGRAPTHQENVVAVEGGATLATLGAGVLVGKASERSAAAKARVENVMRARGVTPEAAPVEAPVTAEAPAPPKPIAEMSPEELKAHAADLERQLNESDRVPGALSERGWKKTVEGTTKHVASVDVDNLKPVNDAFGHQAGDSLIATNGEALRIAAEESGAKIAHIHGDELKLAHDDPAVLHGVAERARQILSEGDVVYRDAEGNEQVVPKSMVKGFSYGVGENDAAAENALIADKSARKAAGLRDERSSGSMARSTDQIRSGEAGGAVHPAPPEVADAVALHADNANPLPSIPDTLAAVKKLGPVGEFVNGINPAGASEGAASAADILRDSEAQISNAATLERDKNAEVAKTFERTPDEENIANISTFERTGKFADAPEGYSEMYKATTDAAHKTLQEVYGDDRVGYVENYIRRAFKFGSATDEAKATGVLSNYIGSLSASKSPLKGRVLNMPLDDALTAMRDAGIDVKPATTNPELLRQWTVENANQARVYKQAWADAKDGNLLQFVKQGDRVPQGMVQLNDRVAQVFRPTEEGPVRTGQYFAEPGVARIFNNAISKGLGGSPTFKAIRAMNNAYNQVQLGLSGFHLTGTAINAGISDLSLGLQQIINGDVGMGARSIGRSMVPTYSFVRDMVNGRNFVNDLLADDPIAKQILDEKFNPAGGRLAIDQSYRNSAYENMVKAWSNGRYIRALGNVPFAVIQKIASPLMEYAIPRVKIGAFLDLAEANRAKLGDAATDTQIQRAYEQAWDSIDNRFGQIVHDNLFWNRTAADLAQVSTRSVGWNLGTLRELGGGAIDLAKGNVSQRTLYALALPIYAGTIGGIFHYLHTGKRPETARDLYYPQNGLKDAKGRDDRVSLPTYMKDVFAYTSDPVTTLEHKASPLLSLTFDLGTNRDYFGDMIRNPEETRSKQLLQMGSYALKQFRPFSVQQAAKTMEEGGVLRAGEQIMGFPSAPAAMKQTAEESEQFKEARRRRNENAMNAAKKKHGG